jgi:hypothetical protein
MDGDVRQSPAVFQPPARKVTQRRPFFRELLLPVPIAVGHHIAQEFLVFLPAGEVPAATQPQGLVHRVLEMSVRRFHVAVLVRLAYIDPLALQTVVRQEVPIPLMKLAVVGEIVHRRREAVAPVPTRDSPQGPEGILQPLAEGLEGLRRSIA